MRKKTKTIHRARSLKSRRDPRTRSEHVAAMKVLDGEVLPPGVAANKPVVRLLSQLSSAERKQFPMAAGLMDYFPDALAMVSNVSFRGNAKHNPGEDLHWARGKSMDHADCIMRHHQERGTLDPDGIRHTAQLAWRAMALLQEELERDFGLSTPRGATDPLP